MIIDTFKDLWERVNYYPMRINYFVKDETGANGRILLIDDMQKFAEKYKDYKVRDFRIQTALTGALELFVILKKGK